MPLTYSDIKHRLQPPLDCSEIKDLRGKYFYNRLIINYESTDFAGCVLYHCYPSGISSALEINSAQSEEDVTLKGANLERAFLNNANLQGANLQGANLQRAFLYRANLQGANLQGANLQGANLQEAKLQGANLQGADLQGAKLRGANLQGADLQETHLHLDEHTSARFIKTNLTGARISENYAGSIFEKCNMQDATFVGAVISSTFIDCDLRNARFEACKFDGASFGNCDFENAVFDRCVGVDEYFTTPRNLTPEQAANILMITPEEAELGEDPNYYWSNKD
jgi:uncharacterized protein YjbI with pentapeptide repeats